jgi:hypothetical protein
MLIQWLPSTIDVNHLESHGPFPARQPPAPKRCIAVFLTPAYEPQRILSEYSFDNPGGVARRHPPKDANRILRLSSRLCALCLECSIRISSSRVPIESYVRCGRFTSESNWCKRIIQWFSEMFQTVLFISLYWRPCNNAQTRKKVLPFRAIV